jgi:hypothetical protein
MCYIKLRIMKKIIFVLIFINIISCDGSDYSQYNTIKLKSRVGEVICLKSKKWGLTYDHQLTTISISTFQKWTEPDSTKEYVFRWLEPFLYEFRNDSLLIYCRNKAPIPKFFPTNIKVIQKEVDNYTDLIYKTNNGIGNLKSM